MTKPLPDLSTLRAESFGAQNHRLVTIEDFLPDPETLIERANLQKFAKTTPQYPGVRATLELELVHTWIDALSAMLDEHFGTTPNGWGMQAWYSIVTAPPGDLAPIQCFPHVDGTDPNQLAMMLYLDRTPHGGTAFFRHRSTGYEALTDETYPLYAKALQEDVRRTRLPSPRYVTDGAPHFERTHTIEGRFNQAAFYRGNLLHSGVIDNSAPLSPDPREGRLTINAFFRPM